MAVAARDFVVEAVCGLPRDCLATAITSDGHVVSFWDQPDGRVRFVWDGAAGEPFDGLGELRDKSPAIFASADGGHIAYMATRGGLYFVGRDGGEGAAFDSLTRSVPPVFSRDGRRLAYGASNGDRIRLILDGSAVGDEQLAPIAAVFSPDSRRLAHVEFRGETRKEAELRIVLDGVPGEWFAGMRNAGGAMQFSPDSRRFAYCRIDGNLHTGWVIDGVPQRMDQEVASLSLARLRGIGVLEPPLAATFSPNSRRFAYFADVPEKGVAIIEDNVPGPLLKAIGTLVFSPDSRHLAYVAMTGDDRYTLVMDGVVGPGWPASEAHGPVFSGDGRHVAVILRRDEGHLFRKRHMYTVIVDGQVLAEIQGDGVSSAPAFSPEGTQLAWWVRQGKTRRMMVNGRPHEGGGTADSDPVFTSSGRLVYAARTGPGGPFTVMIDGRAGPLAGDLAAQASTLDLFGREYTPDPAMPFSVSPDGEHVAWMGKFEGEWRPVLDDQVGPAFEMALAWSFDAAGVATWYAQRGDVVYRVTAAP